jgi:dihydroflavonol-4-reductase
VAVAVTGGSGVVGAAVIRHLVKAGHEVRALARSTTSGSAVAALGAIPVPGDILDPESLSDLVRGCSRVFHVAGINELCTRSPKRMWDVNVEGTRLVVNACRRSGVQRMVLTSSAVTVGDHDPYLSEYERTKTEAEKLAFAEARGLEVVAVNPSSVQGPGRATGSAALILNAARGKLRYLVDTTISLVDINDCARGHLLAAERGEPGQRYVLSGATLTMSEAVDLLNEIGGGSLNPRYLPVWLLSVFGLIGELAAKVLRFTPPVCRETARVMSQSHKYDGSRAVQALGLEYTPIRRTLEETVEWFRLEGLLTT